MQGVGEGELGLLIRSKLQDRGTCRLQDVRREGVVIGRARDRHGADHGGRDGKCRLAPLII